MKKLLFSALLFSPLAAFAFTGETTAAPSASGISSVADFYGVIQTVASWLVVFGIIIGAVFIIWGGIQYMTSGGDEAGTEAAKNKIIGGLIGIGLVLLAYALVNIIGSFLGAGTLVGAGAGAGAPPPGGGVPPTPAPTVTAAPPPPPPPPGP